MTTLAEPQKLSTEGLRKIYRGRQVVQGVSVEIGPGEIVGLLGPNGAGKTTTFYMVVGLTPQEAAQQGLDCISASFPFAANGRAMTIESTDGFVRVVARKDNHLIVGWQAVGGGVAELSTAFVQSIEIGPERLFDRGGFTAHGFASSKIRRPLPSPSCG